MIKPTINIDWIHAVLQLTHDPLKLSGGIVIHIGKDQNIDQAVHHYKAMNLRSSHESSLWLRPLSENSLEISGNIFKFLNHQNVTGSADLVQLVNDLVNHLIDLDIGVMPTEIEMENLRLGRFRLYRVDVNTPILFESKAEALAHLDHVKRNATYPYRAATVYKNGVYFGMKSKRWTLKFYHKGTELAKHKVPANACSDEIKALADIMVRAEISIKSRQLKDWDLRFGYQWDEEVARKLIDQTLSKLKVANKVEVPTSKFSSKKDMQFYQACLDGKLNEFYSDRTIRRYSEKFLTNYGINIQHLQQGGQ